MIGTLCSVAPAHDTDDAGEVLVAAPPRSPDASESPYGESNGKTALTCPVPELAK